ncbi:hypothetical protein [Streptomyces sp. NPDC005408]|uniref:hypothetical protein n=1 Tax=Streptomyces sp. NPDC005408 TaxID=3155341 RepID=UPI0033BE4888
MSDKSDIPMVSPIGAAIARRAVAPLVERLNEQMRQAVAPLVEMQSEQLRQAMEPLLEHLKEQTRQAMAPISEAMAEQTRQAMAPIRMAFEDQLRGLVPPVRLAEILLVSQRAMSVIPDSRWRGLFDELQPQLSFVSSAAWRHALDDYRSADPNSVERLIAKQTPSTGASPIGDELAEGVHDITAPLLERTPEGGDHPGVEGSWHSLITPMNVIVVMAVLYALAATALSVVVPDSDVVKRLNGADTHFALALALLAYIDGRDRDR